MQTAHSLFARFLALAAALAVCLTLVGCGGGQAAAPARVGLDFADKRNQPDVEMSGKFLESYGEGELLYPSASRMEHGTVTPAELSALLDAQDNSAAAR